MSVTLVLEVLTAALVISGVHDLYNSGKVMGEEGLSLMFAGVVQVVLAAISGAIILLLLRFG